ncbi:MAG TPA: hypothetical protein VLY24_03905 [Bryobacteraceae bacterium]|nr:hypothetical protein [Bryobacteraceae bacterium]
MEWLFRSPSVKIHMVRGLVGFALLAVTFFAAPAFGWWALIPGVGALVSLGGCPTCWIVGLAGSILDDKPIALCLDGSCPKVKSTRDAN